MICKFIYVEKYIIQFIKFLKLKAVGILFKGKINVRSLRIGSYLNILWVIPYMLENNFNIYKGRAFKIFGWWC